MPEQMSPEYNSAYEVGYVAYANGLSYEENPHHPETQAWNGWSDGWCDANEQHNYLYAW